MSSLEKLRRRNEGGLLNTHPLCCTAARGAFSSGVNSPDQVGGGPRLDRLASQFTRVAFLTPRTAIFRGLFHIGFLFYVISVPRAFQAPARCARRERLFAGDANPAPGNSRGP